VARLECLYSLERQLVELFAIRGIDRCKQVAHMVTKGHSLEYSTDEPGVHPGEDGHAMFLSPVTVGELVELVAGLLTEEHGQLIVSPVK
jgi:hypothetical protein